MSEIPATPIVPAKPVYPYDDEYMFFDKSTGHYVLTEKYVIEQLGIDLPSRINERNAINPSALVARFLKQASNMVYNYIHEFNTANCLQDLLIAKIPSLRLLIMEAMGEQFYYLSTVGDVSRSTDKERRAMSIDKNCEAVLLRTVPELGTTILYMGDLSRWTCWIC